MRRRRAATDLWAVTGSWAAAVSLTGLCICISVAACAAEPDAALPWMNPNLAPDARADLALRAMTPDEKFAMLQGFLAVRTGRPGDTLREHVPEDVPAAAGWVPGVPRLGIPALTETDASLGVGNPYAGRKSDVATALPSGLAIASTFDADFAYRGAAMVASEAHAKGFNVLLAGGVNLARDPRNGRNFEYLGEDPLLAGVLAGAAVRGVQEQHVVSTVKHFALNANETNRWMLDARIDRRAARESDLLAFELAIERGHPGAVMCAYNKVNGIYACTNAWLLNQVLKRDWRYPGWVMSDWGGVHDVAAALHGLDQESAAQMDKQRYFDAPLRAAVAGGEVTQARVDDMVRRILRSVFAVDAVGDPARPQPINYAAHAAVSADVAAHGMVLLKNEGGILPLPQTLRRLAVIGGHADVGVLAGGGSAEVLPSNGPLLRFHLADNGNETSREASFQPSAPLTALQGALPDRDIEFDSGSDPRQAAAVAARADIAVVFVTREQREGRDSASLALPDGQDALVAAVAAANSRTVVVLETGNPVLMPWLDRVGGVVEAWYPGQEGGAAIAAALTGSTNTWGRLPMTFIRREADFVRPVLPRVETAPDATSSIAYQEGAEVGYKRYHRRHVAPLFAFGYGLSYTHFAWDVRRARGGAAPQVTVHVQNVGLRAGDAVPQLYLLRAPGGAPLRLLGFARVHLAPAEARAVSMDVDPRLLGYFDETRHRWRLRGGEYQIGVGDSAVHITAQLRLHLRARD